MAKHILIVEDDGPLRRLFKTVLVMEGFEVAEASDGFDALRAIDAAPPDLVVLDLGLPMLSGFSVQQEIAGRAVSRRIPVVVVTGLDMDLGGLDVPCILRKPITPDALVSAIRRCLAAGASEVEL
jgi:DNA-binding response OmpR family regulator